MHISFSSLALINQTLICVNHSFGTLWKVEKEKRSPRNSHNVESIKLKIYSFTSVLAFNSTIMVVYNNAKSSQ